MAFLTIFTASKPFTKPHINIIQRNAIQSWMRLADAEVILIGDEPGIPALAQEWGIKNVPAVQRDDNGIPLVSSVMQIGHDHSSSPLLCYANADMILMSDLLKAARQVSERMKDFLLIGQRWNLDQTEPLDFSGDWESRLRLDVAQRGMLFSPWGIDYFIFPRHLYTSVPNFTIGRVAWDNWMIYHARSNFKVAIDGTADIVAVHQNHDYSHLPEQTLYGTEIAKSNIKKAGGRRHIYNVLDTNYEVVRGRVRRAHFRLVRMLRRLERIFVNDKGSGWSWEISLRLQRLQRALTANTRNRVDARRS